MPNLRTVNTLTVCEFGQELRRLRRCAGLTLRSLAQRVTFDYSYLAQVERGRRPGSAKLADRCDQALSAHGQLVRLFADQKGEAVDGRGKSRVDVRPDVERRS